MVSSAVLDRIRSPQVAKVANVALVLTGSVLALLNVIDLVTGVVIVCLGLLGAYVSIIAQGEDDSA